jgi:superfamily I DNA/RNA helicase
MKNLLIDEFQDISGQIVKWIMAVHTVLAVRGEEPSLMAVGDDWQSVYGWRGSDPEFMIRFDDHFGESKLVVMNENFRCGQHIINTAEKLVSHLTDSALQKHGAACGPAAKSLGEVELCSGGDDEIVKLVTALKNRDPELNIFILSRTNEGLAPFIKLAKDKQIALMTMHRAKGLEADYIIIKGDCIYTNNSPLKNSIYALAGLCTTYDAAQQDESLRLAYVSLTRARKKAYWFGDNAKPGGAFSVLLLAAEEDQQ